MAGMIRSRLDPTPDYFSGFVHSREQQPICYEWLKPCETVLAHAQRDGPLRRGVSLQRRSASTSDLPRTRAEPPEVLGSAGVGIMKTRANTPKAQQPKRQSVGHQLWASGAPAPNFLPPSPEEQLWRNATTTAVRAASGKHAPPPMGLQGGNAVAEGRKRRAAVKEAAAAAVGGKAPGQAPGRAARRRKGQLIQKTPDIAPWDSVSQVDTVPGDDDWDAASATTTESRAMLMPHERWDRDISQHLGKNRNGWYDWHGARIIG